MADAEGVTIELNKSKHDEAPGAEQSPKPPFKTSLNLIRASPRPDEIQTDDNAYASFKIADPMDQRIKPEACDLFVQNEEAAIAGGDWSHRRWKIAYFMERPRTRAFFISLVILNGILIGVQVDHGGNEAAWDAVDLAFLTVFTIEVGLRLIGFGWIFFTDSWNTLDFIVVALGINDLMISLITGSAAAEFSVFRLLRIFRIIRVMGFFQRLSMLVEAFIGAMKDVVWVGLLVLIMLYIFGVMVTSFYGNHIRLDEVGVDSSDLFGTVPRSMATLFQIMTMDSWMSGITRPMGNVYPSAWFVMIVWTIVGALGLLNLLTAIFIETLTEMTRKAEEKRQAAKTVKRNKLLGLIQDLFMQFDTDHSGTLDVEEANNALEEIETHPEILQSFRDLGIRSEDISQALKIADTDGNGIEYYEFIQCLSIMDESSQKKDTMRLSKQMLEALKEVTEIRNDLQQLMNPKAEHNIAESNTPTSVRATISPLSIHLDMHNQIEANEGQPVG